MATNFSLCGFYTQWSYSWSFSWRRVWPVSLVCVKLLIVRYQTKTYFFSPHILSGFSKSVHLLPCTSHCLFSFFTLSHLSWFFSFQNPDTNECLSPHACQLNEHCMNTAGSYVCQRLITCPPGYQINNDICEGTLRLISINQHQCIYLHPQWIYCKWQQGSMWTTVLLQCNETALFQHNHLYKPYEYSPFTLKSTCNYDILSTQ